MIKKLKRDELVRGSFILFVMINIFNFLNYLFHFFMGRILTIEDYGVLAVLMSLVAIFAIPTEAIQTIITKYTTKFSGEGKKGKIKDMLYRSLKNIFLLSFLVFLIFMLLSFFLSYYLNISFYLLLATGLIIFFVFSIPIVRGIIQGKKRFRELGSVMIVESFFRVFLGVLLAIFGLKVFGAMIGVLIASILTFTVSFIFIKDILRSKREKVKLSGIYSYSFPVLIVIISIILIYSFDIIFARRFFSPEIAGKYAVASMISKMIFFGTLPISKAMFSISSENYETRVNNSKILRKSLLIVGLISISASFIFLLFPRLLILIFYGSKYTDVANILFILGLAHAILSLTNINLLYLVSINKINKIKPLFLFVIIEIILFYFFHNSLIEFSVSFLILNFIMFICSLILVRK